MNCPHCSSSQVSNRSRLTSLGYKTFWCNNCHRSFNERTGSPYNRRQVPTEIIFEVVLWRLRFKLSLGDLCKMYSIKGFYFTRETVRHWEEQNAPLIADELKIERKGKTTLRWKVDETLLKVKKKFYYLYRAIDSNGQLVDTKLSEVRDSESTTAFLSKPWKAPAKSGASYQ